MFNSAFGYEQWHTKPVHYYYTILFTDQMLLLLLELLLLLPLFNVVFVVFFRSLLFGLPFRLSIVVLVKCNQARDHTIFLHKSDSLLFPTSATVFIQIHSISMRAKRFRYLHSQRQTNGAKNNNIKTTSTVQLS